ncbi:cubilin isoform X1 [Hyalella azteca]|uniref:Cubilin isoform X1 n=2 Tax=Hyalella azteca TaxID=294128 RepID=A0A8B7PQJ3_HYAAZ|nr:cubilin isoform X1 [Hyalella azteca]
MKAALKKVKKLLGGLVLPTAGLVTICAALALLASPAVARRNERARSHCNKTVEIYEDVTSPDLDRENRYKPLRCYYRFRVTKPQLKDDWVIVVRFKSFKVGNVVNATHCDNGYLKIMDGNSQTEVSNRRTLGMFCGEIEQTRSFISETSFVKVIFDVQNFTEETYFSFDSRVEQQKEVFGRYGPNPVLYPFRRGEIVPGTYCERIFTDCKLQSCFVQSPGYPSVYPRNLHCKYYLNTRLPFIKLYIENEEFNIDGQRCENPMMCPMRPVGSDCPYDFIRIYDGKNEQAPLIGTFCGMGRFPHSIIGSGQDIMVEFISSPAGPFLNTGFHFNVGNWPGHVESAGSRNGTCDWVFSSDTVEQGQESIFLSLAHWYKAGTSCSYLIRGRPGEIVRMYFPSFRVRPIEAPIRPYDGDCGETLIIYDSDRPDDSRIMKMFCDTFSRPLEKHDFISSGSSMFVKFDSRTGSYDGSSLYYWAQYDFFNNTHYGRPVEDSVCDELFESYVRPEGRFGSPLNTLIYKTDEDVRCRYSFKAPRYQYRRILVTINDTHFKHNEDACLDCLNDAVDKIIIRDPFRNGTDVCICDSIVHSQRLPAIVVSNGPSLELSLHVDRRHATQNYFKSNIPIFEGTYKFIHSPICGPTVMAAASEGSIVYPKYEPYVYGGYGEDVHCMWEVKVSPERDLWISLERMDFSLEDCSQEVLEVEVSGRRVFTVCATAPEEARSLTVKSKDIRDGSLIVHFKSQAPGHSNFQLTWTELVELPRNSDGTIMTSKLSAPGECKFVCPGQAACIHEDLVCNGVHNCPGSNNTNMHDEAPEICYARTSAHLNYVALGLGAAGGAVVAVGVIILVCRNCRKRPENDTSF